jgi:hypothetical protein
MCRLSSCRRRGRSRQRRRSQLEKKESFSFYSHLIRRKSFLKLVRILSLFVVFFVATVALGCTQINQPSQTTLWILFLAVIFDLMKDMLKECAKKLLDYCVG